MVTLISTEIIQKPYKDKIVQLLYKLSDGDTIETIDGLMINERKIIKHNKKEHFNGCCPFPYGLNLFFMSELIENEAVKVTICEPYSG